MCRPSTSPADHRRPRADPADPAQNPAPLVSVVMPMYNAAGTIVDQLQALADQDLTGSFEVIIADNGSTDESLRIAGQWATRDPRFRVVDASARRGPAAARNIGSSQARADLLAFCDDDDVVEPQWLGAYVTAFTAFALGAEALLFGPLNEVSLADHPPLGATRSAGRPPRTFSGHTFGYSCNCALPRRLFVAVGGFREDINDRCGEDVDLSWRLQEQGHALRFVAEAVVRKRPKPTSRAVFAQWREYGRASRVLRRLHPGYAGRVASGRQEHRALVREITAALAHPRRQRAILAQAAGFSWGLVLGRLLPARLEPRAASSD
jgi:glycosyltransferase involved in cell wall biosynthesis